MLRSDLRLLPVDAADVFAENRVQLSADQRLGVAHYGVKRGDSIVSVDVAHAIGQLKSVNPNGELVRAARAIGVCFGD